jgi:uncharacterized protein
MHITSFFLIFLIYTHTIFGLVELRDHHTYLELATLYGTTQIDEPVLIDLIKHPAFERLKYIRQYGVMRYARSEPEFTRYQHSLGVFFITRLYGASLEEQIDALLHDVSHTVFSHVGDSLFKSDYHTGGKQAYQDTIHEWYLKESGLMDLLAAHGYEHACSNTSKELHCCFDQRLPNLCADRIEYNLTGGYIDSMLTKEQITAVMQSLHFADGQWFFSDISHAQMFARISLQLTENRWGSCWSAYIDHNAACALKRAFELGIITMDEIHFSTDNVIWQKLISTNDAQVNCHLTSLINYQQLCCVCNQHESDIYVHGKFSGTDPLVATENGYQRLTELDPEYQKEFMRIKMAIAPGWYIKHIC